MAIENETGWRLVSDGEFQEFLRRYPRPLTANPPLTQKARFRRFLDPGLGEWPTSEVASAHRSHGSTVNVVRGDALRLTVGQLTDTGAADLPRESLSDTQTAF